MIARRSALLLLFCGALLGTALQPAGAAATLPLPPAAPSAPYLSIPPLARAPEGRIWVRTFAYSASMDRFTLQRARPRRLAVRGGRRRRGPHP